MLNMTGTVFNIQKFCTSDGPGIRTVVFLKGCPLRCAWCHNAESHKKVPEILLHADKCIRCGRCVMLCESGAHQITEQNHSILREKCTACGTCARECLADALELRGCTMSVEEVLSEVCKDRMYFEHSGGGLTLSGGEPFAQRDFALSLLRQAKQLGLHTCVETSGYTDRTTVQEAVSCVDLFLWDIKHTDPVKHQKYTGVAPDVIWENLYLADKLGASMVLRCPIIPGVNDDAEHFKGIAEVANGLMHIRYIELEPYHSFGEIKYDQLGYQKSYSFRVPDQAEPLRWAECLRRYTKIEVKIAT